LEEELGKKSGCFIFRLDYFGLTGVYFELLGGAKFFWSCAKKKLVSIFFV
jgi:hypothetical protein